jgi:hypothetical protein
VSESERSIEHSSFVTTVHYISTFDYVIAVGAMSPFSVTVPNVPDRELGRLA